MDTFLTPWLYIEKWKIYCCKKTTTQDQCELGANGLAGILMDNSREDKTYVQRGKIDLLWNLKCD